MQVTRLACGGFILAYTFNHCICDAYGAYQFITVVSEFCKDPNRRAPSTLRSWERETLRPRSPPIISYPIMSMMNQTTLSLTVYPALEVLLKPPFFSLVLTYQPSKTKLQANVLPLMQLHHVSGEQELEHSLTLNQMQD